MEAKKIFCDPLDSCYAVVQIKDTEHDFILVASETENECFAYDLNNNYKKIVVWSDVGGTMTIMPIPGTLDFLATQRFYPGFNAAGCRIVRGYFTGAGWQIIPVKEVPYLHRFDLIQQTADTFLFIGCTIAKSKKEAEDWSNPGEVILGTYSEKKNELSGLVRLDTRITKNHGYRNVRKGGYSLICGQEGIYKLVHPQNWKGEKLELYKVFAEETSDVVEIENGLSGSENFWIIQGFHGEYLRLYDLQFAEKLAELPDATPFAHALDSLKIDDKDYCIFGYRDGNRDLLLIGYEERKLTIIPIDHGVGASNCVGYHKDESHYIASANNGINEFAIYQINEEE